ncbi:hypothetical protein [Actinomadura kijaniata]|uniref:hypothetical protein n=1 Tax=Actinomadura kijaniata TaxID=46161 RepID=UPI000833801A|nr:hypothetical protein [Actinomadura kijaniata]
MPPEQPRRTPCASCPPTTATAALATAATLAASLNATAATAAGAASATAASAAPTGLILYSQPNFKGTRVLVPLPDRANHRSDHRTATTAGPLDQCARVAVTAQYVLGSMESVTEDFSADLYKDDYCAGTPQMTVNPMQRIANTSLNMRSVRWHSPG